VSAFDWQQTSALEGDVLQAVRTLKLTGDGDIAILGSGVLVRSLLNEGLLDSLRLFIHPLLLGSGKRLFGALDLPCSLTLTNCSTTSMGSVALSYDIGLSQ
jgi:dihydrofolate reductase